MYRSIRVVAVILAFVIAVAGAGAVRAATHPGPAKSKAITLRLLSATAARSYSKFMVGALPQFKTGVTKPMFDAVSAQVAPMLKAGYKVSFVSETVQQGFDITFWRIDLNKGGALTAQLAEQGGKVGGFALRPVQ